MSLTDNVGLLDRLARLERENATLKVELEKYQERANQERVAEIEKRDRLLEATVMATNALLSIGDLDDSVNTALQIIGEALDTDRVNAIENFDHPLDSSFPCWRALEYEWYSSNTVS